MLDVAGVVGGVGGTEWSLAFWRYNRYNQVVPERFRSNGDRRGGPTASGHVHVDVVAYFASNDVLQTPGIPDVREMKCQQGDEQQNCSPCKDNLHEPTETKRILDFEYAIPPRIGSKAITTGAVSNACTKDSLVGFEQKRLEVHCCRSESREQDSGFTTP